MFELSDVQGRVLSRHERFEESLGAFARAVRDGASAATLTLDSTWRDAPSLDPAPEAERG